VRRRPQAIDHSPHAIVGHRFRGDERAFLDAALVQVFGVHQQHHARAMHAAVSVVVAIHRGVELVEAAHRGQPQGACGRGHVGVCVQGVRRDEIRLARGGLPLAVPCAQRAMESAGLVHALLEVMKDLGEGEFDLAPYA